MKFAHMADLHIGGWRDPKMSQLTIDAFKKTVDECIANQMDFIIISGDLFNTSLPNLDYIKETTKLLKNLKNHNIPVYIVAGSHDFSPSGKTMLDVLEIAGLLINVVKARDLENNKIQLLFTQDQKTGAKLTGMLGKKSMLEKSFYDSLDKSNLETEQGFKIFLFHTALDELKPEDLAKMDSAPISLLPKGFDYYAGGHVHIVKKHSLEGYDNIVYPGPLFPNSFTELEKLESGGYYIFDYGNISYNKVIIKHTFKIDIDCTNLVPEQVQQNLIEAMKYRDIKNKIILLRLQGKLKIGKLMDIDLKSYTKKLYDDGAYYVMKNTSALTSDDFEEIKKSFNPDKIEEEVIKEHLGQIKIEDISPEAEKELIIDLIQKLSKEKQEGETNQTYEERIKKDIEFLN